MKKIFKKYLINSLKKNSKIQIKKSSLILLLGAIVVFVWLTIIYLIKGPTWIMVPSDLGYTYLLNGLNLLFGVELGVLIHPAITVSYFYAFIIFLYYSLFGTGELQSHVISNAELYSFIINNLITLGIALSCYFLGNCVYKITNKISYSFLAIISTLAIPVRILPIVFGAPESFLLIFVPIIAGLCFLKANNSCPQKLFVFASGIICAISIGAKFISVPIILLPFFVSKGFKEKLEFLLIFLLSLSITFMPIYLNPQHLNTFKFAMEGLTGFISIERNSFQSENILLQMVLYFFDTFSDIKVFFAFFISQLSIFPFVRPKLFQKYPDLLKISIFNSKLLISLLLSIIFIGIRPKSHYFLIFISFEILGIILSIYLLRRNIEIESGNY